MARAIKTRSSGRGPAGRRVGSAALRNAGNAWTIRRLRGLQVLESRALGRLGWLAHGFSTRPGGASVLGETPALNLGFTDWDERERVTENRKKFSAVLNARKCRWLRCASFIPM